MKEKRIIHSQGVAKSLIFLKRLSDDEAVGKFFILKQQRSVKKKKKKKKKKHKRYVLKFLCLSHFFATEFHFIFLIFFPLPDSSGVKKINKDIPDTL